MKKRPLSASKKKKKGGERDTERTQMERGGSVLKGSEKSQGKQVGKTKSLRVLKKDVTKRKKESQLRDTHQPEKISSSCSQRSEEKESMKKGGGSASNKHLHR